MDRTSRIKTRFSDGRACYRLNRDGCWIWQGAKNDRGYPQVRVNGTTGYAHRYYYLALIGPIPSGLELDHLCRTRLCCNPQHLEPVSRAENVRRGACTKLRVDEVRFIRYAAARGVKQATLSRTYKVHSSTISRIVSGELWADA